MIFHYIRLSLYAFKEIATMEYDDIISTKLKPLQETFERNIEELERQSGTVETDYIILIYHLYMQDDVMTIDKLVRTNNLNCQRLQ